MSIVAPSADQVAAALDLIVAQQQDPTTLCVYVGTERAGVLAELEALTPPWTETLRVGIRDGEVVACACVDIDADDTRRTWIHGPWARDSEAWEAYACPLVDAMVDRAPAGVTDHEICGNPANQRLAALGEARGWHRSAVSIAYVARSAEGWPEADPRVRPATEADLAAVEALHTAEFPDTYASAASLLADPDRVTLVVDGGLGYASAEVKPDGEGYLDFLAVAPEARGRGIAGRLLTSIGRQTLAASPAASVNLTVREDNTAAVALYERFGFVRDLELVAWRSHPWAG
jgi:ribosomal protein S18 acetylase RimI-like enzyme